MADDRDFLRRWSRRKLDAAAQAKVPEAKPAAEPAPALPSVDSLTFESDFKAFMHAKVEESVKRAALKKLFADPRFNVIDFMDVYIDDYTNLETIPPDMLAKLQHARTTLFGREDEKPAEEQPTSEDKQIAQADVEPQKKEGDGPAG